MVEHHERQDVENEHEPVVDEFVVGGLRQTLFKSEQKESGREKKIEIRSQQPIS